MKTLIALLFFTTTALAAPYTTVSTTTTTVSGLTRVATIVQDGSDSHNQFTMTRVYDSTATLRGSVLLMPGQGANFELYEVDELGNYLNSVAGYLASSGYDVWGYSPRTKGIATTDCVVPGSCPWVNTWGLDVIADDANYIRSQIAVVHGAQYPVIGGWSFGAIMTLAVMNKYPTGWSGAIVWEGALYSTDAGVTVGNAVACADQTTQLTAGLYIGEGSLAALQEIATLPALVRDPALRVAATTPNVPPTGFVPGYELLAGSALAYTYASNARLVLALQTGFNAVESVLLLRDIRCSLAGERTFDSNLGSFTAPLYIIRTGHGFGPYMDETLNLIGTASGSRSTNLQSGFGHGDHYAASSHLTYLEAPTVAWLNTVFP
jgi:pimeloyl-ACP methyl ester carboxylesterase